MQRFSGMQTQLHNSQKTTLLTSCFINFIFLFCLLVRFLVFLKINFPPNHSHCLKCKLQLKRVVLKMSLCICNELTAYIHTHTCFTSPVVCDQSLLPWQSLNVFVVQWKSLQCTILYVENQNPVQHFSTSVVGWYSTCWDIFSKEMFNFQTVRLEGNF